MSSEANPRGAAPAYDEAEKGTQEIIIPTKTVFPIDEKKDPFVNDEKKALAVSTLALPPSKEVVPPVPKPAPKPKKKVSKWILWQLWFNTYRSVFLLSHKCQLMAHP